MLGHVCWLNVCQVWWQDGELYRELCGEICGHRCSNPKTLSGETVNGTDVIMALEAEDLRMNLLHILIWGIIMNTFGQFKYMYFTYYIFYIVIGVQFTIHVNCTEGCKKVSWHCKWSIKISMYSMKYTFCICIWKQNKPIEIVNCVKAILNINLK